MKGLFPPVSSRQLRTGMKVIALSHKEMLVLMLFCYTGSLNNEQTPSQAHVQKNINTFQFGPLIKLIPVSVAFKPSLAYLKAFLDNGKAVTKALGQEFDINHYRTIGEAFKAVLMKLLESESVKNDPKLYSIIEQSIDKVNMNTSGSTLLKLQTQEKQSSIDLNTAWGMIDRARMARDNVVRSYNEMHEFMATKFNPDVHLKDFQPSPVAIESNSQGEFLKSLFNHFLNLDSIDDATKRNINIIIPYIKV
uniref:Uncharacterized protein n=1 Tax=Timema poppense TaxID=170557 RepID=A0A7R9GX94_TIMPO|nr:unnamed protein product [Timema poppensis]